MDPALTKFLPCIEYADLPAAMRQLADAVGLEACKKIVELYGGFNLYVPKKGLPENHPLRQQLTSEEYKELIAAYQSSTVRVPYIRSSLAKARIRALVTDYCRGMNVLDLNAKYRLHPDYLRKVIRVHSRG